MANQKHVKLLLSGSEKWNKNKPERADLTRALLQYGEFCEVDFSGSDLFRASLFNACLYRASFAGANLESCLLEGTRISGVVGNGKEIISILLGNCHCAMTSADLAIGSSQYRWEIWEKASHELLESIIEKEALITWEKFKKMFLEIKKEIVPSSRNFPF